LLQKICFLRATVDNKLPMVGSMVVMPREKWTDERLDKAFGRIDGDLRELRVEMKKGFEQVDQRFDYLESRFGRLELWFGTLICTIIGALITGVIAALSLH
jgi:hypothetical protein